MKVTLEHNELLALQDVNRKPIKVAFNANPVMRQLLNCGLIKQDFIEGSLRLHLVITPFGKEVLKQHLPYSTNSYDKLSIPAL